MPKDTLMNSKCKRDSASVKETAREREREGESYKTRERFDITILILDFVCCEMDLEASTVSFTSYLLS